MFVFVVVVLYDAVAVAAFLIASSAVRVNTLFADEGDSDDDGCCSCSRAEEETTIDDDDALFEWCRRREDEDESFSR